MPFSTASLFIPQKSSWFGLAVNLASFLALRAPDRLSLVKWPIRCDLCYSSDIVFFFGWNQIYWICHYNTSVLVYIQVADERSLQHLPLATVNCEWLSECMNSKGWCMAKVIGVGMLITGGSQRSRIFFMRGHSRRLFWLRRFNVRYQMSATW